MWYSVWVGAGEFSYYDTILFILRFLYKSEPSEHCEVTLEPLASFQENFKVLGIQTVMGLYIKETIIFAIKLGQTRTCNSQQEHITLDAESTSCLTNTNWPWKNKKSTYRGAMFCNTLSGSLKNLIDKNFKEALQNCLQEGTINLLYSRVPSISIINSSHTRILSNYILYPH